MVVEREIIMDILDETERILLWYLPEDKALKSAKEVVIRMSKLIKEKKPVDKINDPWCGDECIEKALDQYESNLIEGLHEK